MLQEIIGIIVVGFVVSLALIVLYFINKERPTINKEVADNGPKEADLSSTVDPLFNITTTYSVGDAVQKPDNQRKKKRRPKKKRSKR